MEVITASGGSTIIAPATPMGESAIAVVRLTGSESRSLTSRIFGVDEPEPRHATLGRYRAIAGEILDEVVFVFYPSGASYTGEDLLEISCHGNPFVVQRIIDDCLARGCQMAEPGEFTRRAFLNGRLDLSQAEAVADVIRARSDQALKASQDQLRGVLGREVEAITEAFLEIIAHLEAYIDFPEEDLPEEDQAGPVRELRRLGGRLADLIATRDYGDLLREGVKAVIIGEPNVGKSSLLNRLAGEDRVIVSDEPGTTRDYVEAAIRVGPYTVRLVDTAGVHEAGSSVEKAGISRTLEQAESADLLLVVLDGSISSPTLSGTIGKIAAERRHLVVANKIDLRGPADDGGPSAPAAETSGRASRPCPVSALTGAGIDELRQAIRLTLEEDLVVPGPDAIIVSARHAGALAATREGILRAAGLIESGEPTELAVNELRGALEALGEITGRVDNERMLDKLFSAFCIGK